MNVGELSEFELISRLATKFPASKHVLLGSGDDAAVVAMPDPKWGETPCAFIELKPNAKVTEQDIVDFSKQHLAHFKVPRAVIFGEVPKTSTGKIQKFELRKQAGSVKAIDS